MHFVSFYLGLKHFEGESHWFVSLCMLVMKYLKVFIYVYHFTLAVYREYAYLKDKLADIISDCPSTSSMKAQSIAKVTNFVWNGNINFYVYWSGTNWFISSWLVLLHLDCLWFTILNCQLSSHSIFNILDYLNASAIHATKWGHSLYSFWVHSSTLKQNSLGHEEDC